MDISSVSISNFRSISDEIEIPLTGPITFLVGPNNSGKSNVLRCLALIFNRAFPELDRSLDFDPQQEKVLKFSLKLSKSSLIPFSSGLERLKPFLAKASDDSYFSVNVIARIGSPLSMAFAADIFSIIPQDYFTNQNCFLKDFGQSGSLEHNISSFLGRMNLLENLIGTIHVPSIRVVTTDKHAIPHFGHTKFPGTSLLPETIVKELAGIANPSGDAIERQASRIRLNSISNFIGYCIEKPNVIIRVPHNTETIHIEIDGIEQPISNLGSGIEQLLIIGMAANSFSKKLVLLDEPELHFHPRTQKRMMKHLAENATGKFVIATHSASILDAVEADIVQLENHEKHCRGRKIENDHDRFNAIRNLGHSASELVQANYIIWVEGPSDRLFVNHWISILAPDLTEGIDYSIIFYGGSILAQHSYSDDENDLVKALSVARQFAVYIDSDKSSEAAPLKSRAERVQSEVQKLGNYCWISKGREIENYVSKNIVEEIAKTSTGVSVPQDEFTNILNSEIISKVAFAKKAIANWHDDWPLDLRVRVEELIKRIRAAA